MTRRVLVIAVVVGLAGCAFNEGIDIPIGGALTIRGEVVDFATGMPIAGAITVSASGLVPRPPITTFGAEFTISKVPENSVFQILAAAPPSHRATFSRVIEVIDEDRAGVLAPVISEAYLASLATGCGVQPKAELGVLLVRLVDGQGAPKAGVAAADLVFTGGPQMVGPCFLDPAMMPGDLVASSSSGYVVYFDLAPGSVAVGVAANATMTIEMATSAINAATVTLAEARVLAGPPPMPPVDVSFANDVFPIFGLAPLGRGCVECHSANGEGRRLGGLALNAPNLAYRELTTSPALRVNLLDPEASLVLVRPLYDVPPDHPNATFESTQDRDYQTILVWIREGAKEN